MRIVISGYYGFSNAGDDLILASTIDLLRDRLDDPIISVVTYPRGDIEWIARTHDVTATDGRDVPHASALIADADLLLIGGGGLIQDYLPSDRRLRMQSGHANLGFWWTLAALARLHSTPAVGWQLGVGPLSTQAGIDDASELIELLDLIIVRDAASLELVRSLGIPTDTIALGADPVLMLNPQRQLEGETRIGVAIRQWDTNAEWMQELAAAIEALGADIEVVLIPFQPADRTMENDHAAAEELASLLSRTVTISEPSADPQSVVNTIARLDLLVSMRLHGLVIAAALGVPAIGLAYDPKVEIHASELGFPSRDLDEIDRTWLAAMIEGGLRSGAVPSTSPHLDRLRSTLEQTLNVEAAARIPPSVAEALVAAPAFADERWNDQIEHLQAVHDSELDALGESLSDAEERTRSANAAYEELAGSNAMKVVQRLWDLRKAVSRRS